MKAGHLFNRFKRIATGYIQILQNLVKRWLKRKMDIGDLFYGQGLPGVDVTDLTGKLIVIEGTDAVGRSTQIERLTEWLKVEKYGVISTGWTRSALVGKAIDRTKSGNTLNPLALSLLYASDFANRLEKQIIPALNSGLIVLADRYMYTAFSRNVVRGVAPQ